VNSAFSTLFFFGFNEENSYVFWLSSRYCSVSHLVIVNKNACTPSYWKFMLNGIPTWIDPNQRHRSLCSQVKCSHLDAYQGIKPTFGGDAVFKCSELAK
jgi:hypothetical protein